MSALTNLTLALPAPVKTEDLIFLNTIPRLTTLSLAIHGTNHAVYPEAGKHLTSTHLEQRKSKVSSLTVEGDPFFIFWSTSFFCSPLLHTLIGKVPKNVQGNLVQGLLLIPHILHMVMHHNPKAQRLSIEWDGTLPGHENWSFGDARTSLPADLYSSVTRLRNIETLSIHNVPFPEVIKHLSALPSLRTLRLVPLSSIVFGQQTRPTAADLARIRAKFPSLRHLTILLQNIPNVPPNPPEMTHPGHGLTSLFIVPASDLEDELSVSELIPLATYLDHLFPTLSDVTSYFETRVQTEADSDTLTSWKNLNQLLKSYQNIRHQAVQLGKSLSTTHGGASNS
ncbi:hypothetical protein EST38_g11882 [Candolleomyces aberdarensis]|uniref:Uncharacterized protein n=1 Tax=Candolleomyces aberdarensis TaxID=2316362 RepID=A0A4Q2D3T2_9AGAR|nr:hypothetical protein EST38_g11882 [Candolleomyces aberdarensis]